MMRYSAGIEGWAGEEAYLMLYAIRELPRLNKLACVDEFAPGMLIIGSDGGGMTYALDVRTQPAKIVEVPSEVLSWDEVWNTWGSFEEFMIDLSRRQ